MRRSSLFLLVFSFLFIPLQAFAQDRGCKEIDIDSLPTGTILSNQFEEVVVSAKNGVSRPDLAILFNSANPTPGHENLGTPGQAFGGPGIASDSRGARGNDTPLNQVIIVARNDVDSDNDGLVDTPVPENDGGWVYFDFTTPKYISDITLVNNAANGSAVVAYNQNGQRIINRRVGATGSNSIHTVSINRTVSRLEVRLGVSVGLDDFEYCEPDFNISGRALLQGTNTPIPGVTIEGIGSGTVTDAQGRYSIGQVFPGTYALTASFPGLVVLQHPNPLVVTVDDLTNKDFILGCTLGFVYSNGQCVPTTDMRLSASDGTSHEHVEVNWTAHDCAESYRLYRANVGVDVFSQPLDFAGTIPSDALDAILTFFDTSAVPGVTYNYAVEALGANGEACEESNTDSGYRLGEFNDCDGDGVSDEQEFRDGTGVCDPGSFEPRLKSPAYAKWNTFLKQFNFLELMASGTEALDLNVTVYDIQGLPVDSVQFTLPAGSQQDLDINTLAGEIDTYGMVKVEWNDEVLGAELMGRMTNYRLDPNGETHSFVFTKELSNPVKGVSFATGNSHDPQGFGFLVPNWTEIQNVDTKPHTFTYNLYDNAGTLIQTYQTVVPPMGERDLNGGHENGEGVYLAEVIPHDGNATYFMTVSRYSSNQLGGATADTYNFAFARQGQKGTGDRQYASISNETGQCYSQINWVEVANTLNTEVVVNIVYRRADGSELQRDSALINPKSQAHFNASSILPLGEKGTVEVSSPTSGALLMQSLVYYRDCVDLSAQTAYLSQGRIAGSRVQMGTYNRFLDILNELNVFNIANQDVDTLMTLREQGTVVFQGQNSVQGLGARQFSLSDEIIYQTKPDTYGTVELETSSARQVFAEILRVRPNPLEQGGVDFVVPTPLR